MFLPNCVCVCVCVHAHAGMSDSVTPLDCSLQDSSVHGIFQARLLEQVDISFSRGFTLPRD